VGGDDVVVELGVEPAGRCELDERVDGDGGHACDKCIDRSWRTLETSESFTPSVRRS